jgi:hypothetical protein
VLKKTSSFEPIAALQSRSLSQLQHHIATQQQLTQHVKNVLPESLANQVLHCILKNNQLLIYTHSANWASQLRFYSRVIIDATTESIGVAISTVQTKVIAKPNAPDANSRKVNVPSAEKIEFIRDYSASIQDDQLKAALLKLSETLTQLSSRKT